MRKYDEVTLALLKNGVHVRTTSVCVRTPTELSLAVGHIDDIEFDKYQVIDVKPITNDIIDGE